MWGKQFFLITCLLALLSFNFVALVEANSSTMWSKTYGGPDEDVAQAVVETSDGGYAIAGYTRSFGAGIYDSWLVKTDSSGNMEWNKTYGGPEVDKAYSLIRTSDGGYAIAGCTYSFGAGSSDFWLVKTDASGNMEWSKTYGGERGDDAYALVATSDGGYAIAGETRSVSTQSSSYWLVKTDASGAMEWNRTYGITLNAEAKSLVEKPDGGYAIAGTNDYITHQAANFWFTDELGNGDYLQTQFGGNGALYSLVEASDGGYAMAGDTDSFDAHGRDFWLVKTDESGNIEWNQTYGGTDYDYSRSLVATSDEGYTLAGYTYRPHSETYDCWLVKTDSSGTMEWNRTYGGEWNYLANSLVEASDGGYAIAGEKSGDFWLVKTDELGIVLEVQLPDTTSPSVNVDSPQNETYTTNVVLLNFTVDKETSWIGYSLDGENNVTLVEKTLNLMGLPNGLHSITVYATDNAGNTGTSETIMFNINKAEPHTESPNLITNAIAIVAIAIIGVILFVCYTKLKNSK